MLRQHLLNAGFVACVLIMIGVVESQSDRKTFSLSHNAVADPTHSLDARDWRLSWRRFFESAREKSARQVNELRAARGVEQLAEVMESFESGKYTSSEFSAKDREETKILREAVQKGTKTDPYIYTTEDAIRIASAEEAARIAAYTSQVNIISSQFKTKAEFEKAIRELNAKTAEEEKQAKARKEAPSKVSRKGMSSLEQELLLTPEQKQILKTYKFMEITDGNGLAVSKDGMGVDIVKRHTLGFKLTRWRVGGGMFFFGVVAVIVMYSQGVFDGLFPSSTQHKVDPTTLASHVISAGAIEAERCREMNFAAAEAEGVAQQFLGSLTKWNETVTALKPLYHRAYLQATLSQINNISSTNITNWGPSAPLPVALPTVGLSGEEKIEAERRNEDANRQWEAKEFFRPLHLQHQLVGEYHDAVHESALNLMTKAIDLPYPAESEQFTIAYSSLYLRMAISPECKPHINEGGHITHWLEDSRNKQADRQLLLNGFAQQHFAARSRMDPTLPAPAPPMVSSD